MEYYHIRKSELGTLGLQPAHLVGRYSCFDSALGPYSEPDPDFGPELELYVSGIENPDLELTAICLDLVVGYLSGLRHFALLMLALALLSKQKSEADRGEVG